MVVVFYFVRKIFSTNVWIGNTFYILNECGWWWWWSPLFYYLWKEMSFFYSVESVCTSTHASLCVCLAGAFMKNGGFLSHLFTYVWQGWFADNNGGHWSICWHRWTPMYPKPTHLLMTKKHISQASFLNYDHPCTPPESREIFFFLQPSKLMTQKCGKKKKRYPRNFSGREMVNKMWRKCPPGFL